MIITSAEIVWKWRDELDEDDDFDDDDIEDISEVRLVMDTNKKVTLEKRLEDDALSNECWSAANWNDKNMIVPIQAFVRDYDRLKKAHSFESTQ